VLPPQSRLASALSHQSRAPAPSVRGHLTPAIAFCEVENFFVSAVVLGRLGSWVLGMKRSQVAVKFCEGFGVETTRFDEFEQSDVKMDEVAEGKKVGLAWAELGSFEGQGVLVNGCVYSEAKVGAPVLVPFVDERSDERGSGADERAGERGNGGDEDERGRRNFGGRCG
jgi:hypothetical protein